MRVLRVRVIDSPDDMTKWERRLVEALVLSHYDSMFSNLATATLTYSERHEDTALNNARAFAKRSFPELNIECELVKAASSEPE